MPNDSSAVSDLIRQTHGRRLGTDPADQVLFDCTSRAQTPQVPVPRSPTRRVPRSTAPPRLLDAILPEPVEPVNRFEQASRTEIVQPEHRDRSWPFVVATLFAAALGILVPAYLNGAFDPDQPAVVALPISASPTLATPTAPVVTPVEPTPPNISEPSPATTPVATTDPPATTPVVEPAPQTVTPAPIRPRSKRIAIKRVKAVAKPARAKPAATKAVPVAPRVVVEPDPPRPSPPKRRQQASDSENPL
jgi:hypothetical protein